MSFELVLTETKLEGQKDLGENVFLKDLASEYKVYAFYYPAAAPSEELEDKLRELGHQAGKNFFINIGKLNDPAFDKIASRFEITKYPVIVMTALSPLASSSKDTVTTYVRFDSTALMQSPQRTVQCMQTVFSLFLQGKVADAIAEAHSAERAAMVTRLAGWFGDALKAIGGFIASRDISVSVFEGKFELKRSGA